MKWYDKIDWGPFMWFGCFMLLVLTALFIREKPELKLASDLCFMGAGAILPRIRSSKPVGQPDQEQVFRNVQ